MIAAISLMRRRHDASVTQFRRHWLDVHGPLVCRFSGIRHYMQCHVIASPVINATAREMAIDGFPILFFDNDHDRRQAQRSPEMGLCNVDSRDFVGAVSRVTTDVEDVVPLTPEHQRISLIALTLPGQDGTAEALRRLPRLRGLIRYHVRKQGAAANSTIAHLPVTVGDVAQAWFDGLVDLEDALAGWTMPEVGLFVVEAHWLVSRVHPL